MTRHRPPKKPPADVSWVVMTEIKEARPNLRRALLGMWMRGALRGWGRCGVCHARAEIAEAFLRRWPLPRRVVRRCVEHYTPPGGDR